MDRDNTKEEDGKEARKESKEEKQLQQQLQEISKIFKIVSLQSRKFMQTADNVGKKLTTYDNYK